EAWVDGEADDPRERFVGAGAPEGAAIEHRRAGVNLERGHGHDRLLSARSRWLPRPAAAESSTGVPVSASGAMHGAMRGLDLGDGFRLRSERFEPTRREGTEAHGTRAPVAPAH